MKALYFVFLLSCSLIISSCNLNRNNLSSARLTSQQMLTCQELLKSKPLDRHLTKIDHPFLDNDSSNLLVSNNREIGSIKPVLLHHHLSETNRTHLGTITHSLSKAISVSNVGNTLEKAVQSSVSHHNTTYYPRAMLRKIYLVIWLICLIAAIILLLLTSAFSTPFLSLLLEILLVLTIGGFLVFFSLWLWKKNN